MFECFFFSGNVLYMFLELYFSCQSSAHALAFEKGVCNCSNSEKHNRVPAVPSSHVGFYTLFVSLDSIQDVLCTLTCELNSARWAK